MYLCQFQQYTVVVMNLYNNIVTCPKQIIKKQERLMIRCERQSIRVTKEKEIQETKKEKKKNYSIQYILRLRNSLKQFCI